MRGLMGMLNGERYRICIFFKPWQIMSITCRQHPTVPLCFGWVSTCTPGFVFMPTIHRQLGHSPLWAQLSLLFSEQFAYWHFACGKRLKIACFQVNCFNKVGSENWQLREIGTYNLHSFSLQPGQNTWIW